MTEGDGDSGGRWPSELETGMPEARRRFTHWPGWVWAVPLAAVMVVLWLGVKTWVFTAPTVTVTFDSAEGISAGTPVRYRGLEVGSVESVALAPELDGVRAQVTVSGRMAERLGEQTRFWVVRPQLGSVSITDMISGAYIAMVPGEGEPRDVYRGLQEPPILPAQEPGSRFVLAAERAGGLRHGSPVRFDGTRVGRVLGTRYHAEQRRTEIHVFVRERYAALVREATVFWREQGLSVAPAGTGLQIRLPSLAALLEGAVAFHTPRAVAGEPAGAETAFRLHDNRGRAMAEPGGPRLAYDVRLEGAVGALERGAEVLLEGRRVGRVGEVGFTIDPDTGAMTTTARLAIQAGKLDVSPREGMTRAALREALDARLEELIGRGLRARVAAGTPLIGGRRIELSLHHDAAPATLARNEQPPRLPSVAPQPSLNDALASLTDTAERLGDAPIGALVADLRAVSARLRTLAESPRIERSLDALASALDDLEAVTGVARGDAEALLGRLDSAAAAVEDAAQSVSRLSGGGVRREPGLTELIAEFGRTARAIRELTDYLNRHPEALIEGRERRP